MTSAAENAFLRMDIDRNAAAVILHRDGPVAVQYDVYGIAVSGQGLVDRVIDHLVDHMMQSRSVIGVTDIHARPLAHRFQTAQNLNGIRTVFAVAISDFVLTAIRHISQLSLIRSAYPC